MAGRHLYYFLVWVLLFIQSRLSTSLSQALSKCWFERTRLEKQREAEGQTGERQRETGIDVKWKRATEEWWISEGWIEDERDEMFGGEGHGRGRRGGQKMERLVLGNRVSIDANSSHLERLMDRGQHFCTYPGSLPPQSITRQSIKSSKKPRKAPAEALRVWCGFLLRLSAALLLFISTWCVLVSCWADWEWSNINNFLVFCKTTCAKVI